MIPVDAPSSPMSNSTELRLSIELERGSDSALLRVFSILHRRRCRVLQAAFRGGDGAWDHLDLRLEAPRFYAPRVAHWLSALVEVRSCPGR